MSANDVILKVLGKRRDAVGLAAEIEAELDFGGYLTEPGELYITLDDRSATHETELADGVRLHWCGDVLVGIELRDGLS